MKTSLNRKWPVKLEVGQILQKFAHWNFRWIHEKLKFRDVFQLKTWNGRFQRKWFGKNSSKKIWICHRNVRQKLSSTVVIWHPSGPGMPRYCNLTPKTADQLPPRDDTWRIKNEYQIDQWFKVRVLKYVPSRYRMYFRFQREIHFPVFPTQKTCFWSQKCSVFLITKVL